jgi:hypothetical protein
MHSSQFYNNHWAWSSYTANLKSIGNSITQQYRHYTSKGNKLFLNYCHVCVTTDWFWIDDQIHWILWYSTCLHLQFTIAHARTHSLSLSSVYSHVFTSCCPEVSSSGGCSHSSEFPNYPQPQLPASHSNSSQQLNLSSSLTSWLTQSLTNQLNSTDQLTLTNCPAYVLAWTA